MKALLTIACVILGPLAAYAQLEFFMGDTTVTECEGILFDSERGLLPGHYAHNEDYVFSICVAGADQILLDFAFFNTEEDYDFITFFDGPDVGSPVIAGPFSGTPTLPTIVASSGCLTIQFTSDANVAEPGWTARWRTSNFSPPTEPTLSLDAPVNCPSSSLVVNLDRPVHCDSLYAAAVRLIGPKILTVTDVVPLNCSGDSTQQFRVEVAPPIDFGGTYQLELRTIVPYCNAPYVLFSTLDVPVRGCPLSIRLLVVDAEDLCTGGLAEVRAVVQGGQRSTYQYTWTPVASDADTVVVGPITGPTVVTVSVQDATGASATESITVAPNASPTILGGDRMLCQSVDPFLLEASPPGGTWEASGLFYEFDDRARLYDPQLTDGISDLLTYTAPNGCSDSVRFSFTPLDYGTDDAACPGATPFVVSGGLPLGGTWSGANITPDGTFSPPAGTGTYTVTYTHPNGCAGSKDIHVAAPAPLTQDTFCENDQRVTLEVSPAGGVWSGAGMPDARSEERGWFYPGAAGPGPHTLAYSAEGCAPRTLTVFVKEIYAGENFSACPAEAPRLLPDAWRPAGGYWIGRGIVDPDIGLFDPAFFGERVDTLVYVAPNGCSDSRRVTVVTTRTQPGRGDTLSTCTADGRIRLSRGGRFELAPNDGQWAGPGVVQEGTEAFFDQGIAGIGTHNLTYTANTCVAPVVIKVGQSPGWYGDTICIGSNPVALSVAESGVTWEGDGIINPMDGIFDASVSGTGMHSIRAEKDGCVQRAEVLVPEPAGLSFTPPVDAACFSESEILLNLSPASTRLSVNQTSVRLPLTGQLLGSGTHVITLRAGVEGCEDLDSLTVEVLPPLRLSANPYEDTLCFGEGTTLNLNYSGGLVTEYAFDWAPAAPSATSSRNVRPTQPTTFVVTLSDGCSQDTSLRLPVHVYAALAVDVVQGPRVCHYDSTYAQVVPGGTDEYAIRWRGARATGMGMEFRGAPGFFDVELQNLTTGCTDLLDVELPGHPVVEADISSNPETCVTVLGTSITMLDRSRGATSGQWTTSRGETFAYQRGNGPVLGVEDSLDFTVVLSIANDAGCTSVDSAHICVESPTRLYWPTAFTPNGDDINDTFGPSGTALSNLEWWVVDRWGTIVFQGLGLVQRWDGTHKGVPLPAGVYTIRSKLLDSQGSPQRGTAIVTLVR